MLMGWLYKIIMKQGFIYSLSSIKEKYFSYNHIILFKDITQIRIDVSSMQKSSYDFAIFLLPFGWLYGFAFQNEVRKLSFGFRMPS